MMMTIYKRALAVLMKKPIKLWGVSLLGVFLSSIFVSLCGVAIPALGLAVSLLVSTSLTMVFLHGYRGEDVKVIHLFDCFKDFATIKRVVLGLAWMLLWIFLWSLIPVVGIFFAIVRCYEYRLTPYILIMEPDVPLTEAIRVSAERTKGYKLQMFLADFVFLAVIYVVMFIFGLITGLLMEAVPVLGVLLLLGLMLLSLVVGALSPLFLGLVQAAFYEEISNPTAAPKAAFCSGCGAAYLSDDSGFCTTCGKPRQ